MEEMEAQEAQAAQLPAQAEVREVVDQVRQILMAQAERGVMELRVITPAVLVLMAQVQTMELEERLARQEAVLEITRVAVAVGEALEDFHSLPRTPYSVKNMIHKIELKCRFTGEVLGSVELLDRIVRTQHNGKVPTPEELGFIDNRCDNCNIQHGRFTDMERDFTSAGGTYAQFIAHMEKNNYKNTNLEKAIKNLRGGKDPEK